MTFWEVNFIQKVFEGRSAFLALVGESYGK